MKLDLSPLLNNKVSVIEINENIAIPDELYKTTDIRSISKLKVSGVIDDIGDDIFSINLNVSGTMILPCAVSLEDVHYPFEFNIDSSVGTTDDFEENYKIIANTLDILPILWENIVLEIPNKVIKEGAKIKTQGDGWSLTEEFTNTNNQLSELKELLDMEGKK